ncbi:uncharacterized protein BKCO1_1000184 [Diplodia corticola]|uniref:Uncharacterized protein n=1 Tax=Diplodia corticola TaxID=236234 RepID=A0A1J9SKT3_9PEZI|nr:uncharacterized protein BKCO1_1000184 [Diplodia corticola]OJD40348.1 hypothetical protein BKCO1_1000184 [Diplodia corticola]
MDTDLRPITQPESPSLHPALCSTSPECIAWLLAPEISWSIQAGGPGRAARRRLRRLMHHRDAGHDGAHDDDVDARSTASRVCAADGLRRPVLLRNACRHVYGGVPCGTPWPLGATGLLKREPPPPPPGAKGLKVRGVVRRAPWHDGDGHGDGADAGADAEELRSRTYYAPEPTKMSRDVWTMEEEEEEEEEEESGDDDGGGGVLEASSPSAGAPADGQGTTSLTNGSWFQETDL